MISFNTTKNIQTFKTTFIIVSRDFKIKNSLNLVKDACDFEKLGKANKFLANINQFLVAPCKDEKQIIFIGFGKEESENLDNLDSYRNALGKTLKKAKELEIKDFCVDAFEFAKFYKNKNDFLKDTVLTLELSNYEFDELKSKKQSAKIENISLLTPEEIEEKDEIIKQGQIIAQAINFSRRLSDLPPNIANPKYIAQSALKQAEKFGITHKILNKSEIEKLKMGGVLAVGSGSVNDPYFVQLEYKSNHPNAKKIALVGKGVTFDTGGVSLKPSNYMKGMKYDMSGAATVISTIVALSQLKPKHDVIAFAPLVENMPSGSSYRQDDIVTHFNGMTSLIENTDAEGRVILADALAYAEQEFNPDYIIDVATLTGACVVALGHFYTGMVSTDEKLAKKLIESGEETGDYVWRLPHKKLYAQALKSDVADVANCGNSAFSAGTITAAMYLKKFIKTQNWAHLDIAGTESGIPVDTYLGKGATGVGIKLLVNFIENLD